MGEAMAKEKKPIVALTDVLDWIAQEKKTEETPAELAALRKYWKEVGEFSVVGIGPDNYHIVVEGYFDEKGRLGLNPTFAPPPS